MSLINVRVQPRASRDEIVRREGEVWWIRLAAPPVEGKANAALMDYLSQVLGLPRDQVAIVRGHTSRQKAVTIQGLSEAEAHRRLVEALESRAQQPKKSSASGPLSEGSPGPAGA